jgi:hypothetical protein
MLGNTTQNTGLDSVVIELRRARCAGVRGCDTEWYAASAKAKGYRLREMTEPAECAVCGIGAYRIERCRGYLRGAQRQ